MNNGIFGWSGEAAPRGHAGENGNLVHGLAQWYTPGTYDLDVPAGVSVMWITGRAGGGGGTSAFGSDNGACGGEGGGTFAQRVSVTPGARIRVTVGAGGAGGATVGSNGGATSFGSLITLTGGAGGDLTQAFAAGGTGGNLPGRKGWYVAGTINEGGGGLHASANGATSAGTAGPAGTGWGGTGGVNTFNGGAGGGGFLIAEW
jgi:hypothetical protein